MSDPEAFIGETWGLVYHSLSNQGRERTSGGYDLSYCFYLSRSLDSSIFLKDAFIGERILSLSFNALVLLPLLSSF